MELKFSTQSEFNTANTYLQHLYCYTKYQDELVLGFYLLEQAERALAVCQRQLGITPTLQ